MHKGHIMGAICSIVKEIVKDKLDKEITNVTTLHELGMSGEDMLTLEFHIGRRLNVKVTGIVPMKSIGEYVDFVHNSLKM